MLEFSRRWLIANNCWPSTDLTWLTVFLRRTFRRTDHCCNANSCIRRPTVISQKCKDTVMITVRSLYCLTTLTYGLLTLVSLSSKNEQKILLADTLAQQCWSTHAINAFNARNLRIFYPSFVFCPHPTPNARPVSAERIAASCAWTTFTWGKRHNLANVTDFQNSSTFFHCWIQQLLATRLFLNRNKDILRNTKHKITKFWRI